MTFPTPGPMIMGDIYKNRKNVPAGRSCQNGNECGEPPLDALIGVDCVRRTCYDTTKADALCWPDWPRAKCLNGRVCRKRALYTIPVIGVNWWK